MTAHQDGHNADCERCRSQLASPRPFDEDLCHYDIGTDEGSRDDNARLVQCPHVAVPSQSLLCWHHLEAAAAAYEELTARTAPFN